LTTILAKDIAMMKEMRRQKGEQQRRYRAKQTTKTNKQM
jgi:phage anti-repressor protein